MAFDRRAPDFQSTLWKAWRVPLPPPEKPDHTAGLGMWLLHCPGAHMLWSYWWMGLIHLRPIEGARPAIILTPGAQWEITCFAQDPDKAPNPDDTTTVKMLMPIDWAVQFGDVKSDLQAMEVAEMAVKAIVRGTVSPDSDYRSFWGGEHSKYGALRGDGEARVMTKDQKVDYLEVRGWEKVQRTHQHKPLVFKDPTGEVTEPQRLERAFEIQQGRETNDEG